MSTSFDLRLVAYQPLGARIGVLPDLGFTITSTATGPVLNASVSRKVLGQVGVLSKDVEVAVETWRDTDGGVWREQRDSRFAITQQDYDDRDPSAVVALTGVGLAAFLMAGAALKGVDYYSRSDITTESAATGTISVSGTVFTWSGNPVGNGDRVKITNKGKANKNLDTGSIYYVRDLSGNTFHLSRNPTGAVIDAGSASNIVVARVVTRINVTAHSFKKSQAVRITAGDASGLNDSTTYYIVNPSTNTVQLADKPGGTPIDLQVGSHALGTLYTDVDGQRVFNNAHPGTVMSSAFLEARARGWGVNPTDSSQQMTHSWTVSADSTGAAWTKMADDPATPGISVAFQPGTPATQILSFLLTNQYAEWYSTGRVIGLVNYGTGNDHTVDRNPPVRLGRTASQVPIVVDNSGVRNSYIIRGYGAVYIEQAGTPGTWGVLEEYQTNSGITSKSSATAQANTNIASNSTGQIGYKVTENANEADFLPTIDYSRGDWVAAQVGSDGWTRLRVVEWSFIKTSNGPITVTTTLAYVKRQAITKALTASTTASAGISDGGTTSSPILESDNRKGTAPVVSSVTQIARFAADDSATSLATVSWTAVNADIDGNALTVINYEVWLREGGKTAGYSVGQTAGLFLDLPALPSGRYYEVAVRAQSDSYQWGELSAETEFLTVYPVDVPMTPTAPTVAGRLGQVRVGWDGNVIDGNGAIQAPDPGFAYVQVWYSTTQAGTYTQIGSNMGNAGSVSLSGLAIGSTYWFAFVAFNVVGGQSLMGAATSYTIVGVTGPDLVANSVTANTIAAGAITSDKLNVGAVPAQASPTERVPKSLADSTYWGTVINGTLSLGSPILNAAGLTASASGVTFVSTTSQATQMPVTAVNPVPASGALFLAIQSTAAQVFLQVVELNAAGGSVFTANIAASVTGVRYQFSSAGAVSYFVKITTAGGTAMNDTVKTVHVFEVISTVGAGQGVELSPAGLQFFDNNGSLAMDLTTNSSQYISVYDDSGSEPQAVATIDQQGNGQFNGLSLGGALDFQGTLLTDPNDPEGLLNAAPNGSTWDPSVVPLLDRLGRGPIYDVTWASMNGFQSSAQYIRVAQDQVVLEDGRSYEFITQTGGLQADNTSSGDPASTGKQALGVNPYLELQVNLAPNTSIQSGTVISRGVVYNDAKGNWIVQPVVFAASSAVSAIDTNNRVLPAGVPIYWQLNFNMSTAPARKLNLAEFGNARGLTVVDIGSSRLTRPGNGGDALNPTTDNSTTGASSGSTSGGTTSTSKTVTFYANSSRTWNNGGSSIVSGSGQYTNGAAMYVGTGASDMGSWFGNFKTSGGTSMASVLSGKTVTAATLKIKCNYTYSSGGSTVPMGTGASATAPATIGSPANNTFSASVKAGATKSISLSSTIRGGLSSGGVQAFVIGVASGHSGVYSYFAGATQSGRPTITVTYH